MSYQDSQPPQPPQPPPPPPPPGSYPPPPPPPPPHPGYSQPPYGQTAPYPPGMPPVNPYAEANGKKLAAGLCAIFVGEFGIHKFVLGYTTPGLIMLLGTILTCGIAGIVFKIIAIVEGILYLTKSDPEFYQRYMVERKEWF